MGITELARRSGVNMGTLSLMENGRLIPTGDEFHRIMVALGLIAEQVE
jgi:transcriptional regulator with XRE-family HTH domain